MVRILLIQFLTVSFSIWESCWNFLWTPFGKLMTWWVKTLPRMVQSLQSWTPTTKNGKRHEELLPVILIHPVSLATMIGTTVGLFRWLPQPPFPRGSLLRVVFALRTTVLRWTVGALGMRSIECLKYVHDSGAVAKLSMKFRRIPYFNRAHILLVMLMRIAGRGYHRASTW